jgi:TPR repeat protein
MPNNTRKNVTNKKIKKYKEGVKNGDADAQNNLGIMFYNGEGVRRNYKEAVRLYRLSAKQGYSKAQTNLKNIIKIMKAVKGNKQKSKKLLRLASKTLRKSRSKK